MVKRLGALQNLDPGRLAPEPREVRHRQQLLLLELVRQWLRAKLRDRIGSLEPSVPDGDFQLAVDPPRARALGSTTFPPC